MIGNKRASFHALGASEAQGREGAWLWRALVLPYKSTAPAPFFSALSFPSIPLPFPHPFPHFACTPRFPPPSFPFPNLAFPPLLPALALPPPPPLQIFLRLSSGSGSEAAIDKMIGHMLLEVAQLTFVGVAMGLIMGYSTKVGGQVDFFCIETNNTWFGNS